MYSVYTCNFSASGDKHDSITRLSVGIAGAKYVWHLIHIQQLTGFEQFICKISEHCSFQFSHYAKVMRKQ